MSEIQLRMLYLILVRMVVYHGSNACETSEIIKAMALIYQL
jgi:predicted ATPase